MAGLQDLFTGFWELGEASGTRADSTANGLTLTDNNTVTQNTGKVGNCAQFTRANTEFLSRASTAVLQPGPNFIFQAWIYADSFGVLQYVASKDDGSSSRAFGLYIDSSGNLNFFVGDNGGGGLKNVAWGTTLSLSTWYHVLGWYDSVAKLSHLSVNNGTAVDPGSAIPNQIITNNTSPLQIGAGSSANTFGGRMDQVGFGQTIPTTQNRTDLYNAGAGLSWAAMAGNTDTPRTPTIGAVSLAGVAGRMNLGIRPLVEVNIQ